MVKQVMVDEAGRDGWREEMTAQPAGEGAVQCCVWTTDEAGGVRTKGRSSWWCWLGARCLLARLQ